MLIDGLAVVADPFRIQPEQPVPLPSFPTEEPPEVAHPRLGPQEGVVFCPEFTLAGLHPSTDFTLVRRDNCHCKVHGQTSFEAF